MSAATADRDAKRQEGHIKWFLVAAATTIFKDTLVGTNAAGYLVPMSNAANLTFQGVAIDPFNNSAGANGADGVRVRRTGMYEFAYAGGDATIALLSGSNIAYAQDDQTVDEDSGLIVNDYPVGRIVDVLSTTKVVVDIEVRAFPTAGSVTSAMLSSAVKGRVAIIEIENLAAGVDFAARAEFAAPAGGATITKIGIVPKGSSAGVDDANTAVIAVADGAGNSIVSKTYNTAGQPPADKVYASLGALDATNKVLTANEVVTIAVTQGATADLPAFILILEYDSA